MQLQHTSRHKYRRLVPYILARWRSLALILLLTLFSAAMVALMPWPLKLLVDYALTEPGAPGPLQQLPLLATPESLVIAAALASLALFAVSSALDVALTYLWSGSGQRMVYDLAGDLFRKLQRLSLLFHSKRTVGDSLSRLSGDTWCVFNVAQGVLIAPAQQLFTILTVGLVAWQLDPQLALLLLLLAIGWSPLPASEGAMTPDLKQASPGAPMSWLKAGVEDFKAAPMMSIVYGLIFALIGSAVGVFDIPLLFALPERTFGTMSNPTLLAIPFFIFMGSICFQSGVSNRLYRAAYAWFGHIRGGIAMATVMACSGFAAICGSNAATAATMIAPMRISCT